MVPSIDFITTRIPPPANTERVICDIQTANDIVECVVNSVEISKWYIKRYAYIFAYNNNTILETCNDVYTFMCENFKFNPETGKKQTGRSIRYIIYDPEGYGTKYFDCKHFSTFALATLQSIGIYCHLRLCGYTVLNKNPTHVYVVAYDKEGNEIIIDGTLPVFNRESKSQFIINVKE